MEKYISKLKHILDSDKKTQNLVLGLCLLAVLLFVASSCLEDNEDKDVIDVSSNNVTVESASSTEEKLEQILSEIAGVSEVSVMINYSTTDKIIPVYDVKENTDEEKSEGRTSITSVTEKSVAYKDGTSGKTPIVESTELATAVGAIVVAKGATDENNVSKIKEAVACVTGIPLYKITVFEK